MIFALLISATVVRCCCQSYFRDPMFYKDFNRFNESLFDLLDDFTFETIRHLKTAQTALEDRWGVLQVYLSTKHLHDAYGDRVMDIKARLAGSSMQDSLSIAEQHSYEIYRRRLVLERLPSMDLFPTGFLKYIYGPSLEDAIKRIYTAYFERRDFLNGYMVDRIGEVARNKIRNSDWMLPIAVWMRGSPTPGFYMSIGRRVTLMNFIPQARQHIRNNAAEFHIMDCSTGDAVEADFDNFDQEMPIGIVYLHHHDKATGLLNLYLRPE